MILNGTKTGVLVAIQEVQLHGSSFFDVVYTHEENQQAYRARLGAENIHPNPQAGDQIEITYVLNMPTNIQQRTGH